MKLLSRTRCFKHTQETAAGGEAVGVYLKKNTTVRHWSRYLDSQETWMAYSKQARIFGRAAASQAQTFLLMQMQVKLPLSISKSHPSP